jgi:hypothetical protein
MITVQYSTVLVYIIQYILIQYSDMDTVVVSYTVQYSIKIQYIHYSTVILYCTVTYRTTRTWWSKKNLKKYASTQVREYASTQRNARKVCGPYFG